MKRFLSFMLLAVFIFSLVGCGSQATKAPVDDSGKKLEKEMKVALCTSGPINDGDWNALAYDGLKLIEKNHEVKISYSESVKQSDQEEVIRNYALQGYQVIFAHGFEFSDVMKKLADEFPDTKFIVNSAGVANDKNLASLNITNQEQGFIVGAAAALMSKTNKVAIIGGMEIPPIKATIEGFAKGAKYINPDINVLSGYNGSFEDAAKMKEMMKAYLQSGADVGACVADLAAQGGIEALRDSNALCIGLNYDQSPAAPKNVVLSVGQSYALAMDYVYTEIIEDQFKGTFYNTGLKEDVIYVIDNPDFEVPSEVKAKLDSIANDIKSGKIQTVN